MVRSNKYNSRVTQPPVHIKTRTEKTGCNDNCSCCMLRASTGVSFLQVLAIGILMFCALSIFYSFFVSLPVNSGESLSSDVLTERKKVVDAVWAYISEGDIYSAKQFLNDNKYLTQAEKIKILHVRRVYICPRYSYFTCTISMHIYLYVYFIPL